MPAELWIDKRTALNNLQQRAEHNGTMIQAGAPEVERTVRHGGSGPYKIERIDRGICQVVYEDDEGIEMYRSDNLGIQEAVVECRRLNREWTASDSSYVYKGIWSGNNHRWLRDQS